MSKQTRFVENEFNLELGCSTSREHLLWPGVLHGWSVDICCSVVLSTGWRIPAPEPGAPPPSPPLPLVFAAPTLAHLTPCCFAEHPAQGPLCEKRLPIAKAAANVTLQITAKHFSAQDYPVRGSLQCFRACRALQRAFMGQFGKPSELEVFTTEMHNWML